jgi:hypothetical protein
MSAPSNPHSAPGADIYQDNKTREKVVSRLFDARTTELNQLVASLETKLADAESELQTLKMQADLIYGLLSEIRSLRATAHAPLAAQSESEPVQMRERKTVKWRKWLIVIGLLATAATATAWLTCSSTPLPHLRIGGLEGRPLLPQS